MSSPEPKRRKGRRAGGPGTDKGAPAEESIGAGGKEGAEQRERESGPQENGAGEGLFSWTFRDFLIPYILLSLSMQRAHGYIIEQYLRGLGLANVEMSTLYRTLRQLERDGLVYSTWEPGPEGPARRIYSLTDAGRWWLDAGASALAGYRTIIDRFFGNYSGPAPRPEDDTRKGD